MEQTPARATPARHTASTRRRVRRPRGRRTTAFIVGALVAVAVVVAAGVTAFVLLSPDKRAARDIEARLRDLTAVSSYAEFTQFICAEYRPDEAVLSQLNGISQQSGVNFDDYFVEQIRQSFPKSMDVTHVQLSGDDASVTVESTDSSGTTRTETVQMRNEDGHWQVCDPAVGTRPSQPAP